MISKEQITEFGYAIVRQGRELNQKHIKDDKVVAMHDLLPEGVSNSFLEKTSNLFVAFTKEGKSTSACKYDVIFNTYITTPMTSSFIGMYFREGVSMDDNDAFRIGDNTLNGIERDELQHEREFTWKESHDYEMDL